MVEYVYGRTDCTPEEAGYSEKRLKVLSDYCASLVNAGRVQATGFLMARRGRVFAHQAAGSLNHKENSPRIKVDSIKRIASITKVFTAAAVMKLVEDGKLWLEQPVSDILPEFRNQQHGTINLWNLLTHTSGLPADPGYFQEPYPVDWFGLLDTDNWIKVILSGPVQNRPGEKWNYCSLGFIILGEVISRVSGCHYNDFLEQQIFKPLGLEKTFLEVPKEMENEVCIRTDLDAEKISKSRTRLKNRPSASAGGIYSTLYDLFRLGQCFLNGGTLDGVRVLGRKTVEAMTRNQLEDVPSFHWGTNCKKYRHGLGWGFYCDGPTVSRSCYNHEGTGWLALYVDPDEEFVYVSFSADNSNWDPAVQVIPRTIAWSGII